MAKEIERKFLVEGDGWRSAADAGRTFIQFYLAAAADRSVRVRIRDGKDALLTLKFGVHATTRDEFEYAIPLDEAHEMQAFAIGTVIDKTRHLVVHEGRTFEVDVFAGALAGLAVAELETAEDVPDAALPGWLGREVTGIPAYYNASLALHGLPVEV